MLRLGVGSGFGEVKPVPPQMHYIDICFVRPLNLDMVLCIFLRERQSHDSAQHERLSSIAVPVWISVCC